MKICSECKIEKNFHCFGKDKYNKDGYCYACKECRNAQLREYNKKNPEIRKKINDSFIDYRKEYYSDEERKRKYKSNCLKRTFGIDIDEYEKMLSNQSGVCKICNNVETAKPSNSNKTEKCLSVDHCHKTGKIRGLLCSFCNAALGMAKENKEILARMILYLEEHESKDE